MAGQRNLTSLLAVLLHGAMEKAGIEPGKLQEVRMRIGCPLLLLYEEKEYGITEEGRLTAEIEDSICVNRKDLSETMEYLSGYSLYAFDEELKQGFLTIPGGHRVGVAGKIITEGNRIVCIRHIAFLNIRVSHEKKGCADPLMPFLRQDGMLCHTLIISPPGGGKTTMLRDVIRQVSNGNESYGGLTVGVVDERSELAGAYQGVPQNDLGIRTDVLDGCKKSDGMMMLLRSMSPQVIAVDEIGSSEDASAIEAVFNCGCRLLATVHGKSVDDIEKKPLLRRLLNAHMFERYVILETPGRIRTVFDGRGSIIA